MAWLIESLEHRRFLAGVTLVTHGFGGSASGWVTSMGNLIASQSGPLANQPRYLMTVTDVGHDGGPLTVTSTRLGPAPAQWSSREIIVLLDWSDVAGSFPFGGYHRPTGVVGFAVAEKFLSSFSIPDLASPLAQLPLHLVGHSRGASLVSELARGLGQRGVWVDHVSYLDPHPVDGVRDPLGFDFGDSAMRVYDNVQYADDFWRTDGDTSFDFTGEAVNGAYNLQLTESVLANGGSSVEHSDVHTWYHGTIGPPFSDNDGSTSVGPNWYTTSTTPPMGPRDQVGWRAARLAAGARHAGGLKSAGAFRDAVTLNVSGSSVWDNVQINGLLADQTIVAGSALSVMAQFEDRAAAAGGARDATLTIGLDRDDDPFNGVFSSVAVSTSALGSDTYTANLDTTAIAGAFRVYAKISNGTNARYYYATGRAIVTTPGFTKTWIGPASGGWSAASNWSPASPPLASDKVSIFQSNVSLDVAAMTTKIAQLQLAGGATLNLGEKNLVLDYDTTSPLADVRALLTSGGIHSTLASASGGYQTLGYAESSDVLSLTGAQTANFAGATVDATAVLIRYTRAGDADLNGLLNGDDYFRIDAGFTAQAAHFAHGDFNFDARVDADDYFLLDANYSRHAQSAAPAEAPAWMLDSAWRRDDETFDSLLQG